ncbi:MAG: ATP-dependent zinc metalloprotease FtsH [Planctomycetota bacterium]|jgi:hypothetical protein
MHDPDRLDADTAAYHEAGHAVVAHLLGGEVAECTIESDDDGMAGGATVRWYGVAPKERTRRSALVALAGPLAEARWRGEPAPDDDEAWAADRREVDAALAALVPPAERAAVLQRWLAEVARAFEDGETWECLCRVADGLAAHGTLDRDLFLGAMGAAGGDDDGDDDREDPWEPATPESDDEE